MQTTTLWTSGVFSTTTIVSPLEAAVAELADRGRAVRAQPLAVVGVDPRPSDDARAVLRAEVALVALDDRVDLVGRQEPLLDEHGLERAARRASSSWWS